MRIDRTASEEWCHFLDTFDRESPIELRTHIDLRESARPALCCVLVIALVSIFGGTKLIFTAPQSETVRIASANGNGAVCIVPSDEPERPA